MDQGYSWLPKTSQPARPQKYMANISWSLAVMIILMSFIAISASTKITTAKHLLIISTRKLMSSLSLWETMIWKTIWNANWEEEELKMKNSSSKMIGKSSNSSCSVKIPISCTISWQMILLKSGKSTSKIQEEIRSRSCWEDKRFLGNST